MSLLVGSSVQGTPAAVHRLTSSALCRPSSGRTSSQRTLPGTNHAHIVWPSWADKLHKESAWDDFIEQDWQPCPVG